MKGRREGGQDGRRAGGKEGRRAGGQEGRRQEGIKTSNHKVCESHEIYLRNDVTKKDVFLNVIFLLSSSQENICTAKGVNSKILAEYLEFSNTFYSLVKP